MDSISMGLLRMIATTGGMRPGHDEARKKRLEEMAAEGLLQVEAPKWVLPDQPAPEPTYRLTSKGSELLA